MCCHPQLELGRFDCFQAPHGNWEVEGGHTDAVGNKTRVSYGALETLRMWRGTVRRRACAWVGRAQMRGEATKPAGEMPIEAARI